MKKFQFRLERFLNIKSSLIDYLALALGERIRTEKIMEDGIYEVAREAAAVAQSREPLQNRPTLDVTEIQRYDYYLSKLASVRLQKESELRAYRVETTDIRSRLLAASKERKVLETLKARRQTDHRMDEARREQKHIDDLISTRMEGEISL